jgi:hypothetical protein
MAGTEGRVEAKVTAVQHEEGSEFRTILLDHPQIKKLTTKFAEGINEAVEAKRSGTPWRITYSEVPSTNINPRTNQPYAPRRYWLKGEPIDGATAQASHDDEEVPAFNRRTNPVDAWRIALSTGAHLAVETLPMMPTTQRDFRTQNEIAVAWAEFIYFTAPPERPTFVGNGSSFPTPTPTRTTGSRGAYDEPDRPAATDDGPPPHDDSDLPF